MTLDQDNDLLDSGFIGAMLVVFALLMAMLLSGETASCHVDVNVNVTSTVLDAGVED